MQKYSRFATIAALILLTATCVCLLNCGISQGAVPRSSTKTYVYVSEMTMSGSPPDGGSVVQYQLESNGTLIPLNPATVATNQTPITLTVDPLNRYLFAPGPLPKGSTSSAEYAIGANGTLAESSLTSQATGNQGSPVAFTPNGQFAVVASPLGTINSYTVGATGVFTSINSAPEGNYPQSMVIDPSAKFVYVANFSDNTISQYTLSSTGKIQANGAVPTDGYQPLYITISPQNFLYCTNGDSQSVSEFSINQTTGGLTYVGSFATGSNPGSIAFDPTGRYAYVSNGGGNSVSQFTVAAATGALTSNGAAVSTGNVGPMQIAVDPSGKFAFTANANGSISELLIGSTGMLTLTRTLALGTAAAPVAAEGIAIGQR